MSVAMARPTLVLAAAMDDETLVQHLASELGRCQVEHDAAVEVLAVPLEKGLGAVERRDGVLLEAKQARDRRMHQVVVVDHSGNARTPAGAFSACEAMQGHAGGERILSITTLHGADDHVQMIVADTGPGIAPGQVERISSRSSRRMSRAWDSGSPCAARSRPPIAARGSPTIRPAKAHRSASLCRAGKRRFATARACARPASPRPTVRMSAGHDMSRAASSSAALATNVVTMRRRGARPGAPARKRSRRATRLPVDERIRTGTFFCVNAIASRGLSYPGIRQRARRAGRGLDAPRTIFDRTACTRRGSRLLRPPVHAMQGRLSRRRQ